MNAFFRFSMIMLVLMVTGTASSHVREEIAGMGFVFGGDPEPLIDNEVCFLEWRVTDLATNQPVGDLQDVRIMVTFDGKEFGPFETRSLSRDPGLYRTRHIFTKPGEGRATMTFKKAGEDKSQSITLTFRVGSRGDIEIP